MTAPPMLKQIFFSLLAGSLVLLAGIVLIYTPPPQHANISSRALEISNGKVQKGVGVYRQGGFHLQLDASGWALLIVPTDRLQLDNYPYVHIIFRDSLNADSLVLLWKSKSRDRRISRASIPYNQEKSMWLTMDGIPGWLGEVESVAISIQGIPEDQIVLEQIAFAPASLSAHLKSIYANWTTFSPWSGTSVNFHAGVYQENLALHPVPLMAVWFALSSIILAIRLLLARSKPQVYVLVLPMIFLIAWLTLDMVWQGKLLQQLFETRSQFSGKNMTEKLQSGGDGELYKFIEDVHSLIDSTNARVYVGSASDSRGMRGAYYLYPLNVFWQRHAQELPGVEYMSRGDYLVILKPSELQFDKKKSILSLPDGSPLQVEVLLTRPRGQLFKVL
jgi:hypothetical protein